MVAQYYYGKDHADDAEVQYQKGIFGLKLVLSYIRAYSQPSHLFSSYIILCFSVLDLSLERPAHLCHLLSPANLELNDISSTNMSRRLGIFAFTVESTLVFFL